jgi:hypothetical protein
VSGTPSFPGGAGGWANGLHSNLGCVFNLAASLPEQVPEPREQG